MIDTLEALTQTLQGRKELTEILSKAEQDFKDLKGSDLQTYGPNVCSIAPYSKHVRTISEYKDTLKFINKQIISMLSKQYKEIVQRLLQGSIDEKELKEVLNLFNPGI